MVKERITRQEIDSYKRELLENSVLVGLNEAAAILAVNPRTLLRRADEGKITCYNDSRTSKGIRFLGSELQRYVREMKQTRHLVE